MLGGTGYVGGALAKWFESQNNPPVILDKENQPWDEVNKAEHIYVCLPTPTTEQGCDTSIIEEALAHLEGGKVIIIKSTVLPGTTKRLQGLYPQHKLLHNPEFLQAATAEYDLRNPDRQIVGYTDKSYTIAKDIILELPLAPFERIVPSNVSEMVKYGCNTYFAVKNIWANQLYEVCDKLDINYELVKDCISADKRIERTHLDVWHNYLQKGHRGFAGQCLPKDIKAFLAFTKGLNVTPSLIAEADKINDRLKTPDANLETKNGI